MRGGGKREGEERERRRGEKERRDGQRRGEEMLPSEGRKTRNVNTKMTVSRFMSGFSESIGSLFSIIIIFLLSES
jgi:hypothetical protein